MVRQTFLSILPSVPVTRTPLERRPPATGKWVKRVATTTYNTNPVPKALRHLLKSKEFALRTEGFWYLNSFDKDHPHTFTTTIPSLGDRVKVTGLSWLEPVDEHSCDAIYVNTITIKARGVGSMLERTVEGNFKASTEDLPAVVRRWKEVQIVTKTSTQRARHEVFRESAAELRQSTALVREHLAELAIQQASGDLGIAPHGTGTVHTLGLGPLPAPVLMGRASGQSSRRTHESIQGGPLDVSVPEDGPLPASAAPPVSPLAPVLSARAAALFEPIGSKSTPQPEDAAGGRTGAMVAADGTYAENPSEVQVHSQVSEESVIDIAEALSARLKTEGFVTPTPA